MKLSDSSAEITGDINGMSGPVGDDLVNQEGHKQLTVCENDSGRYKNGVTSSAGMKLK